MHLLRKFVWNHLIASGSYCVGKYFNCARFEKAGRVENFQTRLFFLRKIKDKEKKKGTGVGNSRSCIHWLVQRYLCLFRLHFCVTAYEYALKIQIGYDLHLDLFHPSTFLKTEQAFGSTPVWLRSFLIFGRDACTVALYLEHHLLGNFFVL
jgi:hypothetical protein